MVAEDEVGPTFFCQISKFFQNCVGLFYGNWAEGFLWRPSLNIGVLSVKYHLSTLNLTENKIYRLRVNAGQRTKGRYF